MQKEILTLDDVKLLVDSFYEKVRTDELLKDIFNDKIQGRWPQHLEKMYRFWQTILLEDHTYFGSPFAPHAKLPIAQEHFERWLILFNENIDAQFDGAKAKEAKSRAEKMTEMFQHKIAYYKSSQITTS